MFKSLTDVNTGVVYAWTNTRTGEEVILPQTNWKRASEWSEAEIASLFNAAPEKTEAEPELPLELTFTDDSSVDD
jgi:rhamnogalacturonyl hydrolase YesR